MSYRAYDAVIAAGQTGRTGLLNIALGIGAILLLGYMLTSLMLEMVLSTGLIPDPATLFEGNTPGTMLTLLATFAVWPIAISVALQIAHGRGLGTVLGEGLWRQFVWVSAAMVVLYVVLAILPPWGGAGLEQNTPLPLWLILLPIGLLAVFTQVAAEELLFRGYLQQALAAYGLPPVVWIGLPSLIFGLGHYDAGAGSNAWLLALWAFIFGALMADLTARAGSLGPAIAVHMANNVIALLLTGLDDSLSGLALYTYPLGLEDEEALRAFLPVDFMVMIVCWLAARLALRR